MILQPGSWLGAYEVVALLGKGGMGEVYRAHDTRLGRDVALKVLPDDFAQDPDRLARFAREARTLASLNHPHIAQIHGLEETSSDPIGVRALVMEFVDGEDLSERIKRGLIPLDEALVFARQICDALEAAHEQGIVHRDLKPANIKVRHDGTIKVLDFGLAKALDPGLSVRETAASLANSPTLTAPTQFGMILGTAAYMAPEQAKGRAVDKRADVWAFGCVVYEMLTGRRAFDGEDVSEVLASVINKDPDWALLPKDTPRALTRMLARCLTRERKRRLADISDARLDLEDSNSPEPADATETRAIRRPSSAWFMVLAAAAVSAALMLLVWQPWRVAQPSAPLRFTVRMGAELPAAVLGLGASAVLSRDGTKAVFVGRLGGDSVDPNARRLYVQDLNQLNATPLAGTEGAESPFLSPDGEWVGFVANGKLKKVSTRGGSPITVADVVTARGGAWAEDGSIVFVPDRANVGLMKVSSSGGPVEPLTRLSDDEVTHRWPQILPGDSAVVFTAHNDASGFEGAKLVVQSLRGGPPKTLRTNARYGRYISGGYLLYVVGATLYGAPFDAERLEMQGDGAVVIEGVAGSIGSGSAQFDVAVNSGTLMYLPGADVRPRRSINWLSADGRQTPLRAAPTSWGNLVFSPDGGRLALDIGEDPRTDVWTYDWTRDQLGRTTYEDSSDGRPIWSPDGREIAFSSSRDPQGIFVRPADGSGDSRLLMGGGPQLTASAWHPDGTAIAVHRLGQGADIMMLPVKRDERGVWSAGTPSPFVRGPFIESAAAFSSDGRWVAYQSNETGRNEVYVQPFPGPGPKWPVSAEGGAQPIWSRRRPELFFHDDRGIMVATYTIVGGAFRSQKPRRWALIALNPFFGSPREYDLHPDGDRFAVAGPDESRKDRLDQAVVVLNVAEELRRLLRVRR